MLAVAGIRNGRSLGGKVALVLHGTVGLPQIAPCLAGGRFCADIAPAKKHSAVAVAIKATTVLRSRLECIDVLLELIMVGLLILPWGPDLMPKVGKNLPPAFPLEHKMGQRPIGNLQSEIENVMAERVGFEPTERFPAHSISSAANSTTLAPLPRNCRLPIYDFLT